MSTALEHLRVPLVTPGAADAAARAHAAEALAGPPALPRAAFAPREAASTTVGSELER